MRSIELIELLKLPTDLTDRRSVGPYLSTLEIAIIRELFAARTTSAECSALVVRNCHAAQLGRVYGPRSCNSNKDHPSLMARNLIWCLNSYGRGFTGAWATSFELLHLPKGPSVA